MNREENHTKQIQRVHGRRTPPAAPRVKLSPLVKWAGGKEKELKYVLPNLPSRFNDYYEPFVGGGAVYTAIQAKRYFVNDLSTELINLYRIINQADNQSFFQAVEAIIHTWGLLKAVREEHASFFTQTYRAYVQSENDERALRDTLTQFTTKHAEIWYQVLPQAFLFEVPYFIQTIHTNLARKMKRMKEIESTTSQRLSDESVLDNVETALKSAFYTHLRAIYNQKKRHKLSVPVQVAIFLFIRNFAYSGMFRYNASGEFNVPYGGIGYNRKKLQKKVDYFKSEELKSRIAQTVIENLDFEDFLTRHPPTKNDFVFLDPPYDSEFSTYAQNEFNKEDQIRLARYLTQRCQGKWMLITKKTDFISQLYQNQGLNISSFNKTYLVSFMNRNAKNAQHLLITNY